MDPSSSKMAKGEEGRLIPRGFRFTPSNEELVMYYLLPRLQRRPPVPNDVIIQANVYQCHPDRLIGIYRHRGAEDSWYFVSPRARKYTNGDRPARQTEDGLGRWKASTGMAEGKGEIADGTKFFHRVLGYHEGPVDTETRTKWLMQEITIPQFEKKVGEPSANPGSSSSLDDYVMCKIYVSPCWKNDNEPGPSGVSKQPCLPSAAKSGQAGASKKHAAPRGLSKEPCSSPGPSGVSKESCSLAAASGRAGAWKKQTGKRRVEEKAPKKRARQQNQAGPSGTAAAGPPPPPPLHAGGTHAPSRTAAGCHVHAEMPRPLAYQRPPAPGHPMPPVVYNTGMQVPAQRPQTVAYNNNGMVPAQRPQTVACNNGMQVPAQQQLVAYNNGMQVPAQQQLVAYNNGMQVPAQRPQTVACNKGVQVSAQRRQMVAYNDQVRPPVPYSGQARHPVQRQQTVPHNGQPRPPVQRPQTVQEPPFVSRWEQPDTTEQRERRVLRQHAEEWLWLLKESLVEAYAAGQQPDVGAAVNHHALAPMVPPDDHLPSYSLQTGGGGPVQQSQLSREVPAATSGEETAPAAWPLISTDVEMFVESVIVEPPPD